MLLIEEELREIVLWFLDRSGAESSKWSAIKLLCRERLACGLPSKLITWTCSMASAVLILTWPSEHAHHLSAGIGESVRVELAPMLLSVAIFFSGTVIVSESMVTWQSTGRYINVIRLPAHPIQLPLPLIIDTST